MRSSLAWIYDRRGTVLILFGVVATIWLKLSGQLNLYIHPRYFTFSVVMAAVGGYLCVQAIRQKSKVKIDQLSKRQYISLGLILLSFVALLVLKPSSLSSNIATQRGINSGSNTEVLSKLTNFDVVSPFGNTETSQLTVKDWANLLSQTSDQTFFAGKKAKVSGFVTVDSNNNIFFVSRFVVSCCAVDARPIGVPVYKENWQATYQKDEWVEVSGVFGVYDGQISLKPETITPISQPESPYVY